MKMTRILHYVLVATLVTLLSGLPGTVVLAYDVPTAPSAPSAPTQPSVPTQPTSPSEPTAPDAPDAPGEEDQDEPQEPDPEEQNEDNQDPTPTPAETGSTGSTGSTGTTGTTGTSDSNGQMGDVEVETGDATTTGSATATGNTNTALTDGLTGSDSGASVVTDGNGSGSTNTGDVTVVDGATTIQVNSASVNNNLQLASDTGGNEANDNTGGDVEIDTGDANVTGTLLTAVNTNIEGVMVSEFNILDDQAGDYILDFAANCIIGCNTGSMSVTNSGNGADSTNTGTVNQIQNDLTMQTNEATIGNELVLTGNTGNNEANGNTGGDVDITTGDVNMSGTAVTFANNNIAGNVYLGVVNIFDDYTGDIIFPEELLNCCGTGDVALANSGNGSGSTSTGTVNSTTTDELFQTNVALIDNYIEVDADTGENIASGNTGGDATIETGDVTTDVNVLNIANSNVDGAWWLVLVNEAGNWIGNILGAPGSHMAGSAGSQFMVDAAGNITVTNNGNGSDSTNTGTVNQESTNTTIQTNLADIDNTLRFNGNTGGNEASDNTAGNIDMTTGDVNIVANIINFVNNNLVGSGPLYVTWINVWKSWTGDFVAPGYSSQRNNGPETVSMGPVAGENSSDHTSGNPSPGNTGGADVSELMTESSAQTSDTEQNSDEDTDTSDDTGSNPLAFLGRTTSGNPPTGGSGTTLGAGTDGSILADAGSTAGTSYTLAPITVRGKKVVNINLAWFLLLVPFALVWGIRKAMKRRIVTGYAAPATA